jgi:hypothetical protein
MPKNTKEVAVVQQNTATIQAENLIGQAIEKGASVETMERLLAMRRDLKAEFAKEQFDNAMAKFQGDCPVIKKTKAGGRTKAGVVAYYYAPLDVIVAQTKYLIKNNGLSYQIKTETSEGKVKVTCVAKHFAGHYEESTVEIPLGTKTDIMSESQRVAAAITFAKRYAFCNAFGILTGDEDTDGPKDSPKGTVDKALEMIAKSKDPIGLKEYRKKLEDSKTKAGDKKILTDAVNARLKELNTILDKEDNQ